MLFVDEFSLESLHRYTLLIKKHVKQPKPESKRIEDRRAQKKWVTNLFVRYIAHRIAQSRTKNGNGQRLEEIHGDSYVHIHHDVRIWGLVMCVKVNE